MTMGVLSRRVKVTALRRAHPIEEVVSTSGILLRQSGQAMVGRCPFHADGGRPNLHVYPETESWYCYRCGVGGDVIAFVMRRENVGFAEACRWLSGTLAREERPDVPRSHHPAALPALGHRRQWDRLTIEQQVVMNASCAVYQRALWDEPRALQYLRGRGIPDWVLRHCAIGYADGRSLVASLRRHSDVRVAEELGLLREPPERDKGGPAREFFAGRIVVPELRGGHCIWLIGRTIGDVADRPKYLALGGERQVLGLERTIGRREVFLCEGVVDYLTAVSWGLPAFSPCGTHLPAERLGFLARVDFIYGVLDGDEAGRAAAERFAARIGERWRTLRLPDGSDLNDLGRRPAGRAEFFRLLAQARGRGREEAARGS